jgi:hypothetical protein
MTPVEILKAARELIAKPERWTRGSAARNSSGEHVHARSDDATCWCAIGALVMVSADNPVPAERLLRSVLPDGPGFITSFNDSHDHAEVVALFDRAIASAQP